MKRKYLLLLFALSLISIIIAQGLYDNFDDGVLNIVKWKTVNATSGTGGISFGETGGSILMGAETTNANGRGEVNLTSLTNFVSPINWSVGNVTRSPFGGANKFAYCGVDIGGTEIVFANKTTGNIFGNYSDGNWTVYTSGSNTIVANGSGIQRTMTGVLVSGAINMKCIAYADPTGGAAGNNQTLDNFLMGSDNDAFSVALYNPTDGETINAVGLNSSIRFNTTIIPTTNLNLTNATLNVWLSNGTLFNSTTNTTIFKNTTTNVLFNMSNFNIATYLWNIYACEKNTTFYNCTSASSNFSFQWNPFEETGIVYNNSIFETSNQYFNLQISANPTISSVSARMFYNGSYYTSTIYDGSSNGNYNATNSLDIPLVTGNSENKTFNWEFTFELTDGSTIIRNSSDYQQTVNKTTLVLCNSTINVPYINISTKSAENPFPAVNAEFKSNWYWFLGGGNTQRNLSFENLSATTNLFDFCMFPTTPTYTLSADFEADATGYAKNFHYLTNASLDNSTELTTIYLLNDSKATATVLKVRGAAQRPIQEAIIQIQLYDIGTGTYYTVAMARTNFDGEDTVYLNWYDSLYKFIIIEDGDVVKSTNPYKISETPQIFDILTQTTYSFTKFRDFQYSLIYNNVTGNFVLTYTKPSGEVDQACLRVTKRTIQNDTEICLTCATSSSATLFCDIDGYGNGTYVASFYATGSADLIDLIVATIGGNFADEIYSALGVEDASVYALLFGVLIFGFFLITPVLGIIGLILGIFGAAALGFTTIHYMEFFGMLILGGIIIWILKK